MNEEKEVKKPQSVEEMEAEMKAIALEAARLDLENKKLENEERKAHIVDLKESLEERDLKRETKGQRARTNGESLKSIAQSEAQSQKRCSHKKGGNGLQALVKGGNDQQYAVIKHTFHNGDTWVRCQRCGKTWKPPIESKFMKAGVLDQVAFERAIADYERALEFDTRNSPSGGVMFKYSDGGAYAREVMANTTLR
jgi:hypothetical protein